MLLETQRLIIRPVNPEDETPFVEMASDGSLHDIGFDTDCSSWIKNWITEAQALTIADNPLSDYLAYTIVLKENNAAIGSVGCSYYDDMQKTGITYFIGKKYRNNGYAKEAVNAYALYFLRLVDKRAYQDINDDKAEMYRFYEIKRDSGKT